VTSVTERIADPRDERLADFAELADPTARRIRERDELFVVEGLVAVRRLVESGHRVRAVLVAEDKLDRFVTEVGAVDAPVFSASQAVVESTVGFGFHRGVVASADRRPLPSLDEVIATARRVAVLEGLNDPENLGLIARSARAFGIDALVLDPTCIDPYYRRAVRVSMGEVLLLPVARCEEWPAVLDVIHIAGFESWAMTPAPDAADVWQLPVPPRLAIVLGAEGPGLSAAVLRQSSRRVRIPISSDVDSLNVAHAAAVAFGVTCRPS
jgi:tRNA G18 (ribose-2'-O)-methylase SpoU